MHLPFLPRSESTSPLRESVAFVVLTIVLSWVFWVPGAFLQAGGSGLGDILLAIGSIVPLAVALFLDFWLNQWSLVRVSWFKSLSRGNLIVAILLPLIIITPLVMLRFYQGTLNVPQIISDTRAIGWGALGILLLSLMEEVGWRAFFLSRLKTLPLFLVNLIVGFAWFAWQLPVIIAGRYNQSDDLGKYFIAMFLYAMLLTPFLNRLALRANYNPILPAITRAGLTIVIAIYFQQGRADPLTDTFGTLTLAWLVALNVIAFSQLWQGKRPPSQITELDRVMPLETN